MNRNYLYPINRLEDRDRFAMGMLPQNVQPIPRATEYYLPADYNADFETIIVTEDNYARVFQILADYHAQHPKYGIAYDFEIWRSYHFRKTAFETLCAELRVPVPFKYRKKTGEFGPGKNFDYEAQVARVFAKVKEMGREDDLYACFDPDVADDLSEYQLNQDYYTFPTWMCTFGIEGYRFIFLQDHLVNAGLTEDTHYVGKANSCDLYAHFVRWVRLNPDICEYGVNTGHYDEALRAKILMNKDPWPIACQIINWKAMGMAREPYRDSPQRVNDCYLDYDPLTPFVATRLLYQDQSLPVYNDADGVVCDVLIENKPGQTDEALGAVGLKQEEANMGQGIQENVGLDFRNTDYRNITNRNYHDTVIYNGFDVTATLQFAHTYQTLQQVAKLSGVALFGQGMDLTYNKDLAVLTVLKTQHPDVIAQLRPVFARLMTAVREHQFNPDFLGIDYYLKTALKANPTPADESNTRNTEEMAIVGALYRMMWYTVPPEKRTAIYPEFLINKPFTLAEKLGLDLYRDAPASYQNRWIVPRDVLVDTMHKLEAEQPTLIKTFRDAQGEEFLSVVVQDARSQQFMATFTQTNGLWTRGLAGETLLKTYNQYQKSDSAQLNEQAKYLNNSLLGLKSNGKMVTGAITSAIELPIYKSTPNGFGYWTRYRWNPQTLLDPAERHNPDILDHPFYHRVKYQLKMTTVDRAELQKLNPTHIDDLGKVPCLCFAYDNLMRLENFPIRDWQEIQGMVAFYTGRIIYTPKSSLTLNTEMAWWKTIPIADRTEYLTYFFTDEVTPDPESGAALVQLPYGTLDDWLNPANYTTRDVAYGTSPVNQQHYRQVYFRDHALNGLALTWDDAGENRIQKVKVKANKAFCLEMTDTLGTRYDFRLDCVSRKLVERQAKLYQRDAQTVFNYYGETDNILFAINPQTNELWWDGEHKWNYKIGENPHLQTAMAEFYAAHPFLDRPTGSEKFASSYNLFLANQGYPIVTNVKSGGIHGANPLCFDRNSGLVAYDPDFSSYYPWILIMFIMVAETYQGIMEKLINKLNRDLKKTDPVTRKGAKIMSNSISGKTGGNDEISNKAENKNCCYTGEIQNQVQLIGSLSYLLNPDLTLNYDQYFAHLAGRTPQEIAHQMTTDGYAMMQVINVNTDGNLNLTDIAGFRKAQQVIRDIYGTGFRIDQVDDRAWRVKIRDVFDVAKFQHWIATENPQGLVWTNEVDLGGVFNEYYQKGVNDYFGLLMPVNPAPESLVKTNPLTYAAYEKYCVKAPDDDAPAIVNKVIDYYIAHRDHLPDDWNYRMMAENVKVKGFTGKLDCWALIHSREQWKKDGSYVVNDQYAKFGKYPIQGYAIVESVLFKQDPARVIAQMNDLLYYAYYSKVSRKYDAGIFESGEAERKAVSTNTRFVLAYSDNPEAVGSLYKLQNFQQKAIPAAEASDFYLDQDHKQLQNSQQSILTKLAWLRDAFTHLGQPFGLQFQRLGDLTYVVGSDAQYDQVAQILNQWKDLRGKQTDIPTLNQIRTKLNITNTDISGEVLRKFAEDWVRVTDSGRRVEFTVKKDRVTKVSDTKEIYEVNGTWYGNYIINEDLGKYTLTDTNEILFEGEPTGVYLNKAAYLDLVKKQILELQTNLRNLNLAGDVERKALERVARKPKKAPTTPRSGTSQPDQPTGDETPVEMAVCRDDLNLARKFRF